MVEESQSYEVPGEGRMIGGIRYSQQEIDEIMAHCEESKRQIERGECMTEKEFFEKYNLKYS